MITVLASSAVCVADGATVYIVNTWGVSVSVSPAPFKWVQAIEVDLDGTTRDASTLLLMQTVLTVKKVGSRLHHCASLCTDCTHKQHAKASLCCLSVLG